MVRPWVNYIRKDVRIKAWPVLQPSIYLRYSDGCSSLIYVVRSEIFHLPRSYECMQRSHANIKIVNQASCSLSRGQGLQHCCDYTANWMTFTSMHNGPVTVELHYQLSSSHGQRWKHSAFAYAQPEGIFRAFTALSSLSMYNTLYCFIVYAITTTHMTTLLLLRSTTPHFM